MVDNNSSDVALQSLKDSDGRLWWACLYHQRAFPTLSEAIDHMDEGTAK